jgi:hypothetical protein
VSKTECCNVIVPDSGQYWIRVRISASSLGFRSTTSYDNTVALAFVYIHLATFFFLVFDFGSYSPRFSLLFRLSFRHLYFRFFDKFEDFFRIEDELPLNRYALPLLTLPTYP